MKPAESTPPCTPEPAPLASAPGENSTPHSGGEGTGLSHYIRKVTDRQPLSAAEAEEAFHRIMGGEMSAVEMASLLVALRTKGLTAGEVAGGVRALRRSMISIPSLSTAELVDTCGTGGGATTTFNISTAAAFVAAGAGVRVAKHGNRSFTSRSGSADVLEAMGVRIDLTVEEMGCVLAETGIVFMFAPLLHPAVRHIGPVRRELGFSTIMNVLGPLANPAGARRQVIGVYEPGLVEVVAEALRELGHERALVVHGLSGMDEISPLGPTIVAELSDGEIRERLVTPAELGLEACTPRELQGGGPEDNAELIGAILEGEERGGARTAVVLNAAAAIHVAGLADSLAEGVLAAGDAIDSGRARKSLDRLREASREGK